MNRRNFLPTSTGLLAGGALVPPFARSAADESLPAGAVASGILDALPGKQPLIKRSLRPPNYETPVAMFREAFTPNDAFYVRWHNGVPNVALEDGGCASAAPASSARVHP